jgi:PPP family 3-phenylpropionic acid transporter
VGERLTLARQQRAPRGALRAILRQPAVPAFFFVCFLLQVAHGPYYTFFSVFLEQHGYQRTETGLLWALGVAAEVALFLLMPRLMTRFSLRDILLASLALTALRWLLIAYFVEWLPVLLFAQCLHAATFACCHAVAVEFVRRTFTGGTEGLGMALYGGLCFGGGAAVGAVLSGLLWSASAIATFGMGALVSLLALLIAWLRVHPPELAR